jgi:hypothetical protein
MCQLYTHGSGGCLPVVQNFLIPILRIWAVW